MAILIVEKNLIFNTIREAAAYAGVDPSNVGKAIKNLEKGAGASGRVSAGGLHFIRTDAAASKLKERDIAAQSSWVESVLSPSQKKRAASQRAKHERKQAERKQQAGRQRITQQQRAAKRATHAALQQANATLQRLRKSQLGKAALEDLESLGQQLGIMTKAGNFNISNRGLSGKSETEIKQIRERIEKILADDEKRRQDTAVIRAGQYHITAEQAGSKEWEEAFDDLVYAFEQLRKLFPGGDQSDGERFNGRYHYKEIYTQLTIDAQSMTPEQIAALAKSLHDWLGSEREKKEHELKGIFDKWKAETQKDKQRKAEIDEQYKPIKWS